ncbi:fungal-specific transcription factor domain-containing protein [Colletotrichum cereale]|nr:fungal-specific transcription factor domain-containing protein [Colletotrichum cereale]
MVPPKNSKSVTKTRTGLSSRSRLGCVTCKTKHLKCDETRPACQQCTRKGIKCGGFAQGLRWSFKHQPALQVLTFEDFNTTQTSTVRPTTDTPDGQACAGGASPASCDTVTPRSQRSISASSSTDSSRNDSGEQRNEHSTTADGVNGDGFAETTRAASEEPISPQSTSIRALAQTPNCPSVNNNQNRLAPYSLTPGLADTSSAFVINWFEQVCPAWSGFDSNTNLNRQIAIDLWRTSATVCSSLESMSAAFLASRLPSMRPSALRLMQRATDFIQAELQIVKAQPDYRTVPTGLIFSLFCLGTTVCWIDSRVYGLPFLREARYLIRRLNAQSATFSSSNQDMLLFFNKSLAYCEMLLSVVRDDEPLDQANDDLMTQLQFVEERSPHPWTGVSSLTTRLFSESIRLCRSARHRLRQAIDPQKYFSNALQDLIGAQRLEEQLLELEIPSENPEVDTGDSSTPVSHLTGVAEAYRLSSLLHLYQTFPDLVSLRLPAESPMTDSGSVPWDEWIIPLALRLVKVLEHIPATSGTRVVQPLLYISASTGLRHSAPAISDMFEDFGSLQQNLVGGTGSNLVNPPPLFDSQNLSLYISQMADAPAREVSVSNMSLDVGSARHFVMRRLSLLESSLPPTPVVVAKELVQTIWRAYDNDIGSPTVHWIDVMEDNDLRSMFG